MGKTNRCYRLRGMTCNPLASIRPAGVDRPSAVTKIASAPRAAGEKNRTTSAS